MSESAHTPETLAEAIRAALEEGVLGFARASVEYSRVRGCCDSIASGLDGRDVFIRHLSDVLLTGSGEARKLSVQMRGFIVKRVPVLAETPTEGNTE